MYKASFSMETGEPIKIEAMEWGSHYATVTVAKRPNGTISIAIDADTDMVDEYILHLQDGKLSLERGELCERKSQKEGVPGFRPL